MYRDLRPDPENHRHVQRRSQYLSFSLMSRRWIMSVDDTASVANALTEPHCYRTTTLVAFYHCSTQPSFKLYVFNTGSSPSSLISIRSLYETCSMTLFGFSVSQFVRLRYMMIKEGAFWGEAIEEREKQDEKGIRWLGRRRRTHLRSCTGTPRGPRLRSKTLHSRRSDHIGGDAAGWRASYRFDLARTASASASFSSASYSSLFSGCSE